MSITRKQIIKKRTMATRRHARVRARVFGTSSRPRVCASASLAGLYAQFIDDSTGRTLLAGRDHALNGTKIERAAALGKSLAEKALALGIKEIVFDRGGKKYHGRIKALAEALREGGLEF